MCDSDITQFMFIIVQQHPCVSIHFYAPLSLFLPDLEQSAHHILYMYSRFVGERNTNSYLPVLTVSHIVRSQRWVSSSVGPLTCNLEETMGFGLYRHVVWMCSCCVTGSAFCNVRLKETDSRSMLGQLLFWGQAETFFTAALLCSLCSSVCVSVHSQLFLWCI